MKYVHRFQIRAPLAAVARFHQDGASMAAITPPPIRVEMHESPADLSRGGDMRFTLWMGPLPIHWHARLDQVSATGFRDSMISGPFDRWVHRHTFVELDAHTTEVLDEIEVTLPSDWRRRLVALFMWVNLPLLFAFRSWRTQSILEHAQAGSTARESGYDGVR